MANAKQEFARFIEGDTKSFLVHMRNLGIDKSCVDLFQELENFCEEVSGSFKHDQQDRFTTLLKKFISRLRSIKYPERRLPLIKYFYQILINHDKQTLIRWAQDHLPRLSLSQESILLSDYRDVKSLLLQLTEIKECCGASDNELNTDDEEEQSENEAAIPKGVHRLLLDSYTNLVNIFSSDIKSCYPLLKLLNDQLASALGAKRAETLRSYAQTKHEHLNVDGRNWPAINTEVEVPTTIIKSLVLEKLLFQEFHAAKFVPHSGEENTPPDEPFLIFNGFVENHKAHKYIKKYGPFCEGPIDISILHGKLSHVIQCWLLLKLHHMEKLGEKIPKTQRKLLITALVHSQYTSANGENLWQYTIDIDDIFSQYGILSFCEPFSLNSWLMTSVDARELFPILQGYIKGIFHTQLSYFHALEQSVVNQNITANSNQQAKQASLAATSSSLERPTYKLPPRIMDEQQSLNKTLLQLILCGTKFNTYPSLPEIINQHQLKKNRRTSCPMQLFSHAACTSSTPSELKPIRSLRHTI